METIIDTLTSYYHNLVYNQTYLPNYSEPIFSMPIPVSPHKVGDIIISTHKSIAQPQPYHRHSYYLINYSYKGNYDAFISNEQVQIKEHDLYISQPYVPHYLLQHDSDEDCIVSIRIRKELLLHALMPVLPKNDSMQNFFLMPLTNNTNYQPQYLLIHPTEILEKPIKNIIEILMTEYVEMNVGYETIMDSGLAMLFSLISRSYLHSQKQSTRKQQSSHSEYIIENMLKYMSNHCISITLNELASIFHYHPNYVSALIQRETGQSFTDLLRKYRLNRACTLLKTSSLSVEEIASLVGYVHVSNFYRVFKQEYHMSPREYRDQQHTKL